MKLILACVLLCSALRAQTATVVGAAVRLDAAQRTLILRPDAGGQAAIAIEPGANLGRVVPGTTNLVAMVQGEIAPKWENITLIPRNSVVIRRYAPGSFRFADAQPATLDRLSAGDQVRARGDREAGRFLAEDMAPGWRRAVTPCG